MIRPTLDLFAELLPVGSVITGISAEYGDDFNHDFVILAVSGNLTWTDLIIESVDGDGRLQEIQGDLEAIVESPVTEVYATGKWLPGRAEFETTFVVRTALGSASFIWLGYESNDVGVRSC